MAAASKRFGHARGKKVVKEIRGGLPEQYSNKGFCWSFIGLFIVCVFFGRGKKVVKEIRGGLPEQ